MDQVPCTVADLARKSQAHDQGKEGAEPQPAPTESATAAGWRGFLRTQALQTALRKRAAGVPTYSVPEAAALLSISQEYLYRLIRTGGFPALRMQLHGNQGRYIIPADAIEKLLDEASTVQGECLELGERSSTARPYPAVTPYRGEVQ